MRAREYSSAKIQFNESIDVLVMGGMWEGNRISRRRVVVVG